MGGDVSLKRAIESVCERVCRRRPRCVRDPRTQLVNATRPIVLVVHLRDDDLWRAGERGARRRTGAAVVDGRCDALEQRSLIDLADRQAVGAFVHE